MGFVFPILGLILISVITPPAAPSQMPPMVVQAAAPPVGDIADRLEKLISLRDRGEINQDEYNSQKARLLG